MDVHRAKHILEMKDTVPVQLDGEQPVWIESVDVANGMATVQVGTNPANTETVSVDRLKEPQQ
ncbi:H-type small acid-soluble spore protein [Paenibacillus thiaminolyticus]|uniref:H-type small acid-soluble spore protein n=1 Tax=Paenibacillus thiaminolyticus TaxID=49283 RepID=A0AAP9DTY0_PANTH|nr:H-type small acid-soluble spore protein [Paenibacillus thiaminolyticus]MCY9533762.1 H-type small acid-soluble spore protein [Paenibacillus thiaminolyticus]MCY9600253.1 H-type small acid-soluble spore protein [Paenibacillus thiaminolyticus]MCY9607813.1 H-type small acid-soluble spore protein [Paenibacillus thiaminolyticus]MCY9611934.1 H-type small acid-soluble spore protein [Paenibacillus thiaminolyticus]MCY9617846.1 H-type small acid-soluble spore protein [Paenibacillus thiaminolyticus]